MICAKNTIGIYSLTFPNGDVYIGSSSECETRFARHLKDLRGGWHHNKRAQRVFDKYGEPKFQILEVCDDPKILAAREQAWIDERGIDELLNFGPALPNPFFGRTHSSESRQKMSEAKKGKVFSPEHRQKMSEAGKLRTHSPETLQKMSEAQKGNQNGLGSQRFLGHKHTSETRLKMSEAHKGRVLTPEHRRRISEAQKRRWAARRNVG